MVSGGCWLFVVVGCSGWWLSARCVCCFDNVHVKVSVSVNNVSCLFLERVMLLPTFLLLLSLLFIYMFCLYVWCVFFLVLLVLE